MRSAGRGLRRDLERVRRISSKIEGRVRGSEDAVIGRLSDEQLGDMGEILRLADHLLTKYEDKRDIRDMMEEFVGMIRDSAESLEGLDDEIEELVLSAEQAISRVREAQAGMAERADLGRDPAPGGGAGGRAAGPPGHGRRRP